MSTQTKNRVRTQKEFVAKCKIVGQIIAGQIGQLILIKGLYVSNHWSRMGAPCPGDCGIDETIIVAVLISEQIITSTKNWSCYLDTRGQHLLRRSIGEIETINSNVNLMSLGFSAPYVFDLDEPFYYDNLDDLDPMSQYFYKELAGQKTLEIIVGDQAVENWFLARRSFLHPNEVNIFDLEDYQRMARMLGKNVSLTQVIDKLVKDRKSIRAALRKELVAIKEIVGKMRNAQDVCIDDEGTILSHSRESVLVDTGVIRMNLGIQLEPHKSTVYYLIAQDNRISVSLGLNPEIEELKAQIIPLISQAPE